MSDYSGDFYKGISAGSTRSAQRVVPMIMEMIQPSSVFDFGCGPGYWLEVFKALGVAEAAGLDGPWVQPEQLVIAPSEFTRFDFSTGGVPRLTRERYDVVTSFEVLEHLDEKGGSAALDLFSRLSDVLVVSAAIPAQGGTGHINEQWPTYWYDRFRAYGYQCYDCLRHQVWTDPTVEWWYSQNLLVFARGARGELVRTYCDKVRGHAGPPGHLVHPSLYEKKLRMLAELAGAAR